MNRFSGLAVLAADGRQDVTLGDARVTILVGADHTNDVVAVLDYRMPAQYVGPPAHVHPGFDELFSVLEGAMTFRLGDELKTAGPGETAVVPGSVPHTFANMSASPSRMLIILSPGGFESYFGELAPLITAGPPDPAVIGALAERYGVTTVGPPLDLT